MNKTIATATLSAACLLVSVSASGHPCASVSTVEALASGDVPESIALDPGGNLYYSNLSTIHVRTPGGVDSVFSTLPIPVFALGVKVGPDGCIYNTSVSLDPSVVGAFVWRSCTAGGVAQKFATLDPAGGPNDLAFDDDDNLFVTDPFLGRDLEGYPAGAGERVAREPAVQRQRRGAVPRLSCRGGRQDRLRRGPEKPLRDQPRLRQDHPRADPE